jgi:excisionase family DNA binding protein
MSLAMDSPTAEGETVMTMEIARTGPVERVLLAPKEVAELLGVHEHTLYKWRALGEGPPYLHLRPGGPVRYHRVMLHAWMETQMKPVF